MKTKKELNTLKEEIETVNRKFRELTEDELEQVNGGTTVIIPLPFKDATVTCNCSVVSGESNERQE